MPGSSAHGIFQARILEWGAIFLCQGIFLTQGLNPGIYCISCIGRWVLYHLSHQRSLPTGGAHGPGADSDSKAALTPRLSRASAWEPAPGPAGRGDPDTRREGGSWEDLPGQLREKARSSAIPEARTQAAQRAGPAPGRT